MADDDHGPSFDYIFDPDVELDTIELALLSSDIASKIKAILEKNPEYSFILTQKSNENKQKILRIIFENVLSDYSDSFASLGKSTPESVGVDMMKNVLARTIHEVFESGKQENESGIGGWSISKSIMSSFFYYSRRVRGSSKSEALKQQLKDWEFDFKKEKKVRDNIQKQNVDPIAKKKRLAHWDRRLMFKTQKITEKKMELERERRTERKRNTLDLKRELE